ncbi:MAG: diguanylate cyclase domain-containing protein [Thermoleophilia bacterium]
MLGGALALGLGYAALSKLIAIFTAFGSTTGATFWPGAGLTLAVLLRRPRAEWPYYVVAVAVAEAGSDVWQGFPLPVALAWGLANTAEPLVAAWLLTRRRPLWRPDHIRRAELGPFVLAAIVVGPMVGALLGTAAGALLGGDPWLPRLPRWYVGDAVGVLVVAPALLALPRAPYRLPSAHTAAWFAVLVLTSLVALGPWTFAGDIGLPFLVVPVLIGLTLRVGPHGAAAGVLAVAMLVETVTASGSGPFAEQGAFDGLVVAQMFVAMSAVTAYTVAVLTGEVITREQLEGTLRAQALRDSLTGLANRRLLFDRLENASRRLARQPGLLALLFIDLDGFKAVNDTHGHVGGDAVLVEAADRLRAIVRDHDSVARLGGDEFLILAEQMTDVDDALALGARVVEAFGEPFRRPGGLVRVDASVGIAATSEPVNDLEAFLSRADSAMYEAKRAGGRRVAIVGHGPAASARRMPSGHA